MKNKQNLHIHTTYVDGKDTPEELIQAALDAGFSSIGFSEHAFNPYSSFHHQMPPDAMEAYKKECRQLKEKYAGKLDVFCGLELDLYSNVPTDGLDYIIGSVHYLKVDGTVLKFDSNLAGVQKLLEENFGGDGLLFAKKYYETVASLPQRADFDILGHFDLLTKNNEQGNFLDVSSKEYLHAGFEAIHALKGKIPLFEVNTGAISRGYRTTPYPQIEFLKEFARCGFGVVITSDCHNKNYIDCFYEEAEALVANAGFRTKWILTDQGFKEVLL